MEGILDLEKFEQIAVASSKNCIFDFGLLKCCVQIHLFLAQNLELLEKAGVLIGESSVLLDKYF